MGLEESQRSATLNLVRQQAIFHIQRAMQEGRLEFIDSDTIKYTSQFGKTKFYTFKKMADEFLDITHTRENLATLGIGKEQSLQWFKDVYSGNVGETEKIPLDKNGIERMMLEKMTDGD